MRSEKDDETGSARQGKSRKQIKKFQHQIKTLEAKRIAAVAAMKNGKRNNQLLTTLAFHLNRFIVKLRLFFIHPADETRHRFVLLQAFYGMVITPQLRLGENGVYFIVTDFVQQHGRRTAAAFANGYQVMTIVRLGQYTAAQRAIFKCICFHAVFPQ